MSARAAFVRSGLVSKRLAGHGRCRLGLTLLTWFAMAALPPGVLISGAVADTPSHVASPVQQAPGLPQAAGLQQTPGLQQAAGLAPPADSVDAASVQTALAIADQLRDQIAEYQRSGDTWRPEIAEVMLSLGDQLQALGEYEDALETLERAVHLTRVNHGLFSPQQLPALARQADIYLALNDWEEAHAIQQYMFFVQTRAFPELGPDQIPDLERFARWHFQAYEQRRGEYPAARLIDTYNLLSVILTIVEEYPDATPQSRGSLGRDEPRFQQAALSNALRPTQQLAPDDALRSEEVPWSKEEYLQQMAYVAWLMHQTGVQRRPEAQISGARWIEDGWLQRTTGHRHLYGRNPYLQGLRALEGIVALREASLQEVTADDARYWELRRRHGDALLNLADWQLLFARRQGAARAYEAAWLALEDAPASVRRRVFERVVVLPAYRDALRGGSDQQALATRVAVFAPAEDDLWQRRELQSYPTMLVQFDINRFGRAASVNVIEAAETMQEAEQNRMLGLLRNNLLRPVIREGRPAHVEGLEYRFAYMIESHLRPGQ